MATARCATGRCVRRAVVATRAGAAVPSAHECCVLIIEHCAASELRRCTQHCVDGGVTSALKLLTRLLSCGVGRGVDWCFSIGQVRADAARPQ